VATRPVALLVVLRLLLSVTAAHAALVNVAGAQYGTRAEADTAYGPEYSGANAVDGSLEKGSGCWYSRDKTTLPCALTFELTQPEDLRKIVLHQAFWNGNMYHTRQFAVEVSEGGETWRRVETGELPDESLAQAEVALDVGKTRWLRVVVLSSYNSFQTCGLAEVELLAAGVPGVGKTGFELNGNPAQIAASYCGFSLIADDAGPQIACLDSSQGVLATVRAGETASMRFELQNINGPCVLGADVDVESGGARVELSAGAAALAWAPGQPGRREMQLDIPPSTGPLSVELAVRGDASEASVWLRNPRLVMPGRELALRIPAGDKPAAVPPPILPPLRAPMEAALIEWDWRLQDGIGTPRNPSTRAEAVERTLQRGSQLIADLQSAGVDVTRDAEAWSRLSAEFAALKTAEQTEGGKGEDLWRRVHRLRRAIALANPLAQVGPLVFAKQVPGAFSHQLTQYYGRYARPGGGICVLEAPGRSMQVRSLTDGQLPGGSYQHPEVTYDGKKVLFSYCRAETPPADTRQGHHGRYYHLYEIAADGSGLRQITDGPFDEFTPRLLPDDRILFMSTRRLGWHRCGSPGCENYTLTVANPDGSDPRPISYHETQEWDPAVLNDGRIIYTRWDYVDRNAVFFEQLWTTAPDGTRPAIFYGNNTFNPVGIWEPRPIPGSRRVMATAGAHHAMTAGSIILVTTAAGVDGKPPIIRLTPDVPFPEGEVRVPPSWFSARAEPNSTPENERWPGHCFRSPYPLSERYFLAAYSFEGLVGEPKANVPNMFGLYLVDSFGNKELLYRDLAISSTWPIPLRPRPRPPIVPAVTELEPPAEGTVMVQNVYAADPALPPGSVKRLRVLQVLPKSTPGIDRPSMGRPRGAPGKQVLGTVPVAEDGSAYFTVPAKIPLAFQALDERGQAIQVMRSLTYLQPGEALTCVGCHEPRTSAPLVRRMTALGGEPSTLEPGPDGSKPFSYPILVQPVLDRACVKCHSGSEPNGGVRLTGEPDGRYTVSYNALAPRVPISDQGSLDAVSIPDRYGARGSALMKMLLKGHHDVKLSDQDVERLVTWMDANALFYGTFLPADQARQQRAERIAGPDLE